MMSLDAQQMKAYRHATGVFRGVLCQRCNVRLAALEDADFVAAATTYIKETT
jgi:hypothetical protein